MSIASERRAEMLADSKEYAGALTDCQQSVQGDSDVELPLTEGFEIGNRPQAKALMRYLKEYQARHDYAFSFGTEASLNLAGDAELLRLLRDANFH